MTWYFEVLSKYAVFNGRARRKEYWYFMLFDTIILLILRFIDSLAGTYNMGIFVLLYTLATLIPTIAVSVRRLHDIGRSGWWYLLGLVPLIGTAILIVFFVRDSDIGINQYGPNPKRIATSIL